MDNGWSDFPLALWMAERPEDSLGDLPFWHFSARRHGSPILDVCCGTGRISIPLARLGYEVVGVDCNPRFVERARGRAAAGVPATFRVGDVTDLPPERRFRLAIMPDWSFPVLLTTEDQRSFLRTLRAALLPGGAFAFNTFIPSHRRRGLVERDGTFEWPPDPAYHGGARRTFDPATRIETLVEPGPHPIRLRHTTLEELERLLDSAGFAIGERYGDVDRRPSTGAAGEDYTLVATAR